MSYYLAIDIGASSRRHMLGSIEDRKIKLEEVYIPYILSSYIRNIYKIKL